MRMRLVTVCLLVLGGLLGGPSLTAEGSPTSPAHSVNVSAVAQQQPRPPISTFPPLPQTGAPRFSTIPPLPPTPTSALPLPTRVPVASPTPVRVVPAAPPISPPRPAVLTPVPASAAPRAGGFPTEVAVLLFTGSVATFGGSLYLFRRLKAR
jgi:hypothetical protein